MTDVFKALSDETRLRILSLILKGEMCVCEIEDCLGLTQSNASRHLTALKNAGILSSSKQAQWAYYSMRNDNKPKFLDSLVYDSLRTIELYQKDMNNLHIWLHQKKDTCCD